MQSLPIFNFGTVDKKGVNNPYFRKSVAVNIIANLLNCYGTLYTLQNHYNCK